ncbi:gp436 family protein [Undibacterium sp. TJN19]|uniref:gp436 family protein n=1 Tax=Undibacterium sp. TJN19 TaxID=3413055 RepID=UPI003BF10733
MNYCTKTDLITAFGMDELIQTTDRENATVINDVVLNNAINDAEAEINVWLAGRYVLPLPSVPEILRKVAMDITRYHLWIDVQADHPVAVHYDRQLKLLKSIATGTASLGLDAIGAPALTTDTVQIATGRNDFGDRRAW